MSIHITILDYGMCNLLNVARAFEHCGANILITDDPNVAQKAERLVVPGVGAYAHCMSEIISRGLDGTIKKFISTDRPFLGICVGMQILFESSEEFGHSKGLGILQGAVKLIPNKTVSGENLRVPHIGWNKLVTPMNKIATVSKSLIQINGSDEPTVYFVHSFQAHPIEDSVRLADTIYGGHRLCAAVQKDNLIATQFHPERSGNIGLNIIRQFMCL